MAKWRNEHIEIPVCDDRSILNWNWLSLVSSIKVASDSGIRPMSSIMFNLPFVSRLHSSIWFENRKHCRTISFSPLLNEPKRDRWIRRPSEVLKLIAFKPDPVVLELPDESTCMTLPCLTKTWFTSSSISQPPSIMRSIAKFLRMFSVSLTSSCICFQREERKFRNEKFIYFLYLVACSKCLLAPLWQGF